MDILIWPHIGRKRSAAGFFATALARLGVYTANDLMAGDDIETGRLAAQRRGPSRGTVKTGKYFAGTHRSASGTPDHVLSSFAAAGPAGATVMGRPTRR